LLLSSKFEITGHSTYTPPAINQFITVACHACMLTLAVEHCIHQYSKSQHLSATAASQVPQVSYQGSMQARCSLIITCLTTVVRYEVHTDITIHALCIMAS
jgi:hypothetical protein